MVEKSVVYVKFMHDISPEGKQSISNIEVYDVIPNTSCSNAIFVKTICTKKNNFNIDRVISPDSIPRFNNIHDNYLTSKSVERVWVKFSRRLDNYTYSNRIQDRFIISVYKYPPSKEENDNVQEDVFYFRNN